MKQNRGRFAVSLQRYDDRTVLRKDNFGTRAVVFQHLREGNYLIRVRLASGDEITRTVEVGPDVADDGGRVSVELDVGDAVGSANARGELHAVALTDLTVPDEARSLYERSWDATALRDWTRAKQLLEKAVELAPEYDDAWVSLAMAHRSLEDLDEAERCLRKAIEVNEECFPAILNLSGLLAKQGKLDAAVPFADRAHQLRPHDLIANLHAGMLAFRRKQYRQCIPFLREVAEKDPSNYENPQLMLMLAYEATGQLPEAAEQAAVWIRQHPKDVLRPAVESNLQKLRKKLEHGCMDTICS